MDVDDVYFQQDGATCHISSETIGHLCEKFPDRVISRKGDYNWPPRSCDLTYLDFSHWGYVKDKVYANPPQSIKKLREDSYCYRWNRAPNVRKCNGKCHQKSMVKVTRWLHKKRRTPPFLTTSHHYVLPHLYPNLARYLKNYTNNNKKYYNINNYNTNNYSEITYDLWIINMKIYTHSDWLLFIRLRKGKKTLKM